MAETPQNFDSFLDMLDMMELGSAPVSLPEDLRNLLLSDSELRTRFILHTHLVSGLHWLLDPQQPLVPQTDAVGSEQGTAAAVTPRKSPVLGFLGYTSSMLSKPVLWSILAAGLVFSGYIALITWGILDRKTPIGTNGVDSFVATITDSFDAKWSDSSSSPLSHGGTQRVPGAGGEGVAVIIGEPLQINSGLVELKLKRGATLLVEGPASWTIDGDNRATLKHGKLVAKVPQEAVGFTLDTLTAKVIDLGTEFGASVTDSGDSSIRIFAGQVDVRAKTDGEPTTKPHVLSAGQNVSVRQQTGGATVSVDSAADVQFARTLKERRTDKTTSPPSTRLAALLADPALVLHYTFDGPADDPDVIINQAATTRGTSDGKIHGATWASAGRNEKPAFVFSSPEDYVALEIPGEFTALTMAASVYIDPPRDPLHWQGLVMSDRWKRPGQFHWEIVANNFPQIAIQSVADVYCPMPLLKSDCGRWIILAVVCDINEKSVVFYCDGAEIGRRSFEPSHKLVLGPSRIGNWLTDESFGDEDRSFRGKMDELMIFGRALSTEELGRLFR